MLGREEMYRRYASLRDEKGVTDYRVCKDIGIALSDMSHWKKGDYTPKVDKILKIANYFGVALDYFYS